MTSPSSISPPALASTGSTTPTSTLILSPSLSPNDNPPPPTITSHDNESHSPSTTLIGGAHMELLNGKQEIVDVHGRKRVEVWGHRGASANLPENTLASFRAAILEGCEGIESDVHATTDNVILMFHDPTLDRTTTGKGKIKEQSWAGNIEHVRTVKEPIQPVPRFEELVALIMEPQNMHVILNIDCKIQNDPETLFPEMAKIISSYPDYQRTLSPRIILGLWHPLFINPAKRHLPSLTRFYIGVSTNLVRKYFWDACSGFSIAFPMLMNSDGQRFLKDCKEAGKEITVWTVNEREEMIMAAGWGVKAILTDKVKFCADVRKEWEEDPSKLSLPFPRNFIFPWTSWKYYSASQIMFLRYAEDMLSKNAYKPGPLEFPAEEKDVSVEDSK